MTYASTTEVPVSRSKAAIEQELTKYGAEQFISGWGQDVAYVGFRIAKRMVKIRLPLPKAGQFARQRDFEQAERARWRALFW